jgi:hypothetical protein
MTILEDAIFSLTDFAESDAEIVFLPEGHDGRRRAEVWHRGDYQLLSEHELRCQMEVFLSAREAAYPIIADWLRAKKGVKPAEQPRKDDPDQPRLDLPPPPR